MEYALAHHTLEDMGRQIDTLQENESSGNWQIAAELRREIRAKAVAVEHVTPQ